MNLIVIASLLNQIEKILAPVSLDFELQFVSGAYEEERASNVVIVECNDIQPYHNLQFPYKEVTCARVGLSLVLDVTTVSMLS